MAFGDNPSDPELRDAWHSFCDQVKAAGEHVFKDASGASDGERTNAFRYLTQNLSQAFDIWLENRDTRHPTLHAFCGPTRGLGCDNADCIYLQSWINDHDTYKISGNIGTAKMFNITVQGPWMETLHEPFGDRPVANLFGHQIETDWNGDFIVWISPDPHPGNWIESTTGIRKIFYRQYFDGWDEVPATFRIERVGESDNPPPALEPTALIDAFLRAGDFVVNTTKDWPDTLWEREGASQVWNRFRHYGGPRHVDAASHDRQRGRTVATMNWDIGPEQSLVLEFNSQPEWWWQLTACSLFGASLEFRYRQINLTSGMTPVDADGATRIVLSHGDPGFANWIDTQEHTRGWVFFRNMFTGDIPELDTRVVATAELEREIGNVATRITPEERRQEMTRRRQAYMRRYAP